MEPIIGQDISVKSEIKILVVDDREDNLFSIEAILEKDNYTIIKATSGRAALKVLLQEHDFSLILMDVQMPDLNGIETAQIIYERDKLKNIPIIFITAHDYDEDYMFKGYKMGGVDYISKPINPELLRVKVGVFVELYRKNHQLQLHEKKLMATNYSLQKEIEERKASEEKVRLLNEQLVQNNAYLKSMNEELDRFAYMASHDLQEPLRKIMVFSDKILLKQPQDTETEKYFRKIIGASKRMQSLINDLLSFSRQSMSSDDFKEVDLDKLLREVIAEFDLEVERTGARIEIGKMPVIHAVSALIRQLFYNLISNGLKFRKPNETPVIKIHSERVRTTDQVPGNNGPGKYYHRIIVSDNGIGFDPKYADEIFMVFKRLHSHQEIEGTGVGLAICKKIVEKHNGFIIAEGRQGHGASFIIGLPEQQPE